MIDDESEFNVGTIYVTLCYMILYMYHTTIKSIDQLRYIVDSRSDTYIVDFRSVVIILGRAFLDVEPEGLMGRFDVSM